MKQPQLGHTIATIRRAKGYTQEQLANNCGINVRSLQRIENGETMPRIYTLKRISEHLERDLWSEVASQHMAVAPKEWWRPSTEEGLNRAIKTGWIGGIIYFLLSIPETAIIFWRYSDNLDFNGKISYTLVSLTVVVSAVLFYWGFVALGSKLKQSMITVGAYLIILLTLVLYSFDIYTIWWGIEREFFTILELLCFGFAGIFFGIGLTRAESALGNSAKIAGILELVAGVCFILMVTSLLGLIILLPAIIAQIIVLYKAYELYSTPENKLVMS
ncbi:MAG: hypothetical protein DHS20C17_21930 [Cyclobacteriaceae bacterium]|nr:MAG: hypothetical protein DHS20C17_21930 [Cyclobacteriaceae bacterium]